MNHQPATALSIALPDWVHSFIDWNRPYQHDDEKMALAIKLAEQNILRGTGGPFGAAIFDALTGKLLSIGVNCVVMNNNSALHAEVMAIMLAEERLGSFSLAVHSNRYELFSSCEPCAMCLGATLWSGVKRLVCAATGEDARAIGFDEGPVFVESFAYLQDKGIEIDRGFMRLEGQAILQDYARRNGPIYNP
jgi:tRNA(Arg) A34 adenosine deaminase TadA